jgi:hypothetical protein
MFFKVKIDMPIILMLVLIVAVLAVPVFLYFPSVVSVVFILFISVVLFGCWTFTYKITDKWLSVRFGIFGWRFRLDSIKVLIPLKKPHRLKLVYGNGSYTYLSVKDPAAFSAALQAKLDNGKSL